MSIPGQSQDGWHVGHPGTIQGLSEYVGHPETIPGLFEYFGNPAGILTCGGQHMGHPGTIPDCLSILGIIGQRHTYLS